MANVGVIGTGMIGQDHIRRITQVLSGAAVVAVTDANDVVAKEVAAGLVGATVHSTGEELIADPDVDAVIVCSWGPTHEEYVLAGIAAGKPVFCEKPLATTEAACRRIIAAEVTAGRRLVQVGFMRRFDAAYRALKAIHRMPVVTARGDRHDVVSRVFVPYLGIDEDPVTGSAHAALVPYWIERLGRNMF